MKTRIETVSGNVLRHLQSEEEFLVELRRLAEHMRETLLAKRNSDAWDAEHFEKVVLRQVEEISRHRLLVRIQIASVLEVPQEQATVRDFAARCDQVTSDRINQSRSRIQSKAIDLNGVLAANGSLAYRLWSLVESVLRQLRGEPPNVSGYRRNGLRDVA